MAHETFLSGRCLISGPMMLLLLLTIVAIGHGLLKKIWPLVLGCVLCTAGSSIIWNYADPLTSLELLNYYLTLVMSSVCWCCYLTKKFWPFGTRLRSMHCRELNYLKLCRPAYFISTTLLTFTERRYMASTGKNTWRRKARKKSKEKEEGHRVV